MRFRDNFRWKNSVVVSCEIDLSNASPSARAALIAALEEAQARMLPEKVHMGPLKGEERYIVNTDYGVRPEIGLQLIGWVQSVGVIVEQEHGCEFDVVVMGEAEW